MDRGGFTMSDSENKVNTGKRKWYFKALKQVMKIKYKEPTFIYLDGNEKLKEGSIILSNH